jgi:hypothetical protein
MTHDKFFCVQVLSRSLRSVTVLCYNGYAKVMSYERWSRGKQEHNNNTRHPSLTGNTWPVGEQGGSCIYMDVESSSLTWNTLSGKFRNYCSSPYADFFSCFITTVLLRWKLVQVIHKRGSRRSRLCIPPVLRVGYFYIDICTVMSNHRRNKIHCRTYTVALPPLYQNFHLSSFHQLIHIQSR